MSKVKVETHQTTSVYEQLENFVGQLREDYVRFFEYGNVAAGKRLRKNLMVLKKYSHELRKDIINSINDWKN